MLHQSLVRISSPIRRQAAAPPERVTVVDVVRKFRGRSGIYEVRWHEARRRRSILVTVDDAATAEATIAAAVAGQYRPDRRPCVVIPAQAWR